MRRCFQAIVAAVELRRTPWFLFVASVVIFAAVGWWIGRRAEERALRSARLTGRGLVGSMMLRLHSRAFMAPDRAAAELATFMGYDFDGEGAPRWSLIQPGQAAAKPIEETDRQALGKFQPAPLPATGPAAAEFRAAPPEFIVRPAPETNEFVYYEPLRAKGACIVCHNTFEGRADSGELREGDLMAVVKVVLPDGR